jgi:hypothetical protein
LLANPGSKMGKRAVENAFERAMETTAIPKSNCGELVEKSLEMWKREAILWKASVILRKSLFH